MTTAAAIVEDARRETAADRLFKQLVLRDVRMVKWSGEILHELPLHQVVLSPANGGYLVDHERVACRFDQEVELLGEDGERITLISAAVVVDFHFAGDITTLSAAEENAIGEQLVPGAWGVAYPYVREAIQTMSTRLGLDPVTLGVLNYDDLSPQDVHVRGVAEFRDKS